MSTMSDPQRFKIDQIVFTTKLNPNPDGGWTSEFRQKRQSYPWGLFGVVVDVHDSHGLYYDVKHEDGVVRQYDHEEFIRASDVDIVEPQK